MEDLFFKGEIQALETDREGKLRGGFCALSSGGADLFLDGNCSNMECVHTNKTCENACGSGSGAKNNTCTNTCTLESSDVNVTCTNVCGTTNSVCKNPECTTPDSGQKGVGFSMFHLGDSALF